MKNKILKIVATLLSIVFVLSTCMTVFAISFKSVTESQNGIEATLSFDNEEYKVDENVNVTLNVKNNNSYVVKNIQTEIIVPSTMKLTKGSLKQEDFSLNAGESKAQEIVLEKVVGVNMDGAITNSPQTGDNVVVYIAMMVISASALVVIAVKKKWINKKGVISFALCFTLVGAMTLTSVVNADATTKEFTVEGTIKVDGEDVVIKGKVTYTYEIYNKLQIDGENKGMYVEGDTVTITAEDAPEGKHFTGWTVVKGNVTLADKNSKTTSFVMGTEEVEIKANYEVNKYTITSTANEGGIITGSATVNYGENTTLNITANTGYDVVDVKVNGNSKGKISSYTFENVMDNNQKIEVFFGVTTTESFERALTNGGTIYLAQDIALPETRGWYVTKSLTIYGNGHQLGTFAAYLDGTLRLIDCKIPTLHAYQGDIFIENCSLSNLLISGDDFESGDKVNVNVFSSYVDFVYCSWSADSLSVRNSTFVRRNIEDASRTDVKFYDGTFYFDPTQYVNIDTHKVTQTKDSNNKDIWVVTEK